MVTYELYSTLSYIILQWRSEKIVDFENQNENEVAFFGTLDINLLSLYTPLLLL